MFHDSIKENGFVDIREFNELVAKVDISRVEKQNQFKEWQDKDGTKAGLLQLLNESPKEVQSFNTLQVAETPNGGVCSVPFESVFYQNLPVSLSNSSSVIEYIHSGVQIESIKKTN